MTLNRLIEIIQAMNPAVLLQKLDTIGSNQNTLAHNQVLLDQKFDKVLKLLNEIVIPKLDAIRFAVVVPGRVTLVEKREVDMSQWGIIFGLPPKTADDLATKRLTITDNQGSEPIVKDAGPDADQSEEFAVPKVDGLILTASLVFIDTTGNPSQAREETFTVLDNVPPGQPGDFGIVAQREIV